MRRSAAVALAGSLLSATILPLSAQRVVSSVDVSGTGLWYADSIRSAGTSISPAFRIDWSHATLNAFANVSRLGNGGSSVDGAAAPSIFTPSAGPFTAEFAGSLGGSSHQDGTRTGQLLALARGYVMMEHRGMWIGGGGGRTWDGSVWRNVRQGEVGVWLESRGVTALATATPVVVEDTIRYTDFQTALRYTVSAFDFGVTAGARAGSVGAAIGGTSRSWGSVSVSTWMTPRLAVVANGGSYPVDLTQGYPGGRFVTIALRIASRNSRATATASERAIRPASNSVAEAAEATRAAGATEFQVRTVRGTERAIRVYAPAARTVEINADFTQWQPLRLTRGPDGWWTVTRPLTAGTYQMNLRIDGGTWLAPPGLLTTGDEFGGIVGILTIE